MQPQQFIDRQVGEFARRFVLTQTTADHLQAIAHVSHRIADLVRHLRNQAAAHGQPVPLDELGLQRAETPLALRQLAVGLLEVGQPVGQRPTHRRERLRHSIDLPYRGPGHRRVEIARGQAIRSSGQRANRPGEDRRQERAKQHRQHERRQAGQRGHPTQLG